MKFQQYTGPVAAKGVEDTAFYTYNRLVSLNEVGGDPRSFGISLAAFHAASQEQALRWPHTLLATSTHDTKRSEDVRARIDVLSELPAEWLRHLRRWRRVNRGKKRLVDGQPAPSRNDEYLLYQTLLGVWPLADPQQETGAAELERLHQRVADYMLKAVREAKQMTGWLNPNGEYEQALADFIAALFVAGRKNLFLADFLPFQKRVARYGLFNSLSQTLIKLAAPGVPDIYQGNEMWDFSLVDPDNRRAVDYALRQAALADIVRCRELRGVELAAWARSLSERMEDGHIKLYLTWCGLQLRRRMPELFQGGLYVPLRARGAHAEHVCAFARRSEHHAAIVVAPRLCAGLSSDGAPPLGSAAWEDTWLELPADLAGTRFTNVCTGEPGVLLEREGCVILTLAAALENFPVALYGDIGLE